MVNKYKLDKTQRMLKLLYASNKKALLRYLLIGVTAVISDNCVFVITYKLWNGSLLLATVLALATGFSVSFLGNKLWVFASNQHVSAHPPITQLMFYTLLFIFNVTFTFYFINVMETISINAIISKILTTILITAWNYILYKKVIFK